MRRFVIDSRYLGTDRHVVGDEEGYSLSDSVPRDAWHLDGRLKGGRCLDTLLRLDGKSPTQVPQRYSAAMAQLTSGSIDVPWRHILPHEQFRIFFKNVVEETKEIFPSLPFDYHEAAWAPATRLLSSLRPAKVDPAAFESALSSNPGSPGLESFRPKRSGFAHPVVYDRFATRTGRLTVVEGPNVLLLKRNLRGVIRSSFDGGSIVSLDFRALEARVVLDAVGREHGPGDLYTDLSSDLFGGRVERDLVKVAVISVLYGVSRSALRARLSVSDAVLDDFIRTVEGHFKLAELRDRLGQEVARCGRIVNRFGRPVAVPVDRPDLHVNSYAQSSGVDVSLVGFDQVVRTLGTEGIRPIFVLHDALILDVRSDRLKDVADVRGVSVGTCRNQFPLKMEVIS